MMMGTFLLPAGDGHLRLGRASTVAAIMVVVTLACRAGHDAARTTAEPDGPDMEPASTPP
jgi:hypothetical protein